MIQSKSFPFLKMVFFFELIHSLKKGEKLFYNNNYYMCFESLSFGFLSVFVSCLYVAFDMDIHVVHAHLITYSLRVYELLSSLKYLHKLPFYLRSFNLIAETCNEQVELSFKLLSFFSSKYFHAL